MITVAHDGTGDFNSIQEAVDSVSMLPETIFVKKGIYHEIVNISMPYLTIEGEDANETIIEYDNYANMILENDEKRGTFRSYTMLITADYFTCSNITIANTSGFGKQVGQAIAVYAESDHIHFKGCRILGHQDTLFTGPLPNEVVISGGFTGPTEFAERKLCRQIYTACYIEGEVDFIFGSAAAYFDNCELYSIDRGIDPDGYVTAPSTYQNQKYGYIFNNCRFTGNCPPGTVYISRPWRIYAQTVLLNCELGEHIKSEGFHDWDKTESHETVTYAEYNCFGPGADRTGRVDFARELTTEEAEYYSLDNFKKF